MKLPQCLTKAALAGACALLALARHRAFQAKMQDGAGRLRNVGASENVRCMRPE